jgi:hypothetical protein
MKHYSATALAKLHGIAPKNLLKSFQRHGIKPDRNGKFTDADYLKAKQMGAAMDKSKLAEQAEKMAEQPAASGMPSPATLTYARLQRQIKKLDIDIAMAQVELDGALGKAVPVEKYKADVVAVQSLMIAWVDQIIEAISTKRKDAELMAFLRKERDRVCTAIVEST